MDLLGVVLAGGISKRFNGFKLAYKLRGKPLLAHVADELSTVASDVVIVASPQTRRLVEGLAGYRVVTDSQSLGCGGPLRGLATASMIADTILYAPGDAAWIRGETMARLARIGSGVTTPIWGDGFLPMLFGYAEDLKPFIDACMLKGWSGRPSDAYRLAEDLRLVGVSLLTGDPREFSTLNRVDQLEAPPTPLPGKGEIRVPQRASHLYKSVLYSLANGDYISAYLGLIEEASIYGSLGVEHIVRHIAEDLCRVQGYILVYTVPGGCQRHRRLF
ncbi:MAG: NTP transferase domain-containing protein [Desulfurococcales archaeon]|nr:NTP transferase domain-containing protein [Desulfurococcales archaeon]